MRLPPSPLSLPCRRKTVGIYAGVGILSGLMVCLHKVRGNL